MLSKGKKKKKIFNKLLGEGNNYLLSGMENQDFILIPIAQTTFKNTKIIKTEKNEQRTKTFIDRGNFKRKNLQGLQILLKVQKTDSQYSHIGEYLKDNLSN